VIEDYCWIGNTSTINGNVTLPVGTIVGSNSLVNKSFKDIEPFSIIAGIPAKLIKTGFRRIFNTTTELELISFFKEHPHETYKLASEHINDSKELI